MVAKFTLTESASVTMRILAGLAQVTGVFGVVLNVHGFSSLLFLGAVCLVGFYAGLGLQRYWMVPLVCLEAALSLTPTFCLMDGGRRNLPGLQELDLVDSGRLLGFAAPVHGERYDGSEADQEGEKG
jgi:hypothetical protein